MIIIYVINFIIIFIIYLTFYNYNSYIFVIIVQKRKTFP